MFLIIFPTIYMSWSVRPAEEPPIRLNLEWGRVLFNFIAILLFFSGHTIWYSSNRRYTCTEYCTHTKWLLLFLPKQKNEKSPLPQFSNSAHYALLNSSQWQISTATSVDHMGAVWLCHCDCHQWWPCDCGAHSPYMWWSHGHCGPPLVQALLRRLILKIILIDGNEDVGLSESEAQLSHL